MGVAQPLALPSTIPDLLAADGFIFVSPRQRKGFLGTPWVAQAKKDAAPVIPIGPNIMSTHIDAARVAEEKARTRGEGALRADVVVGFFGVLYASKRPDLLLRVVRRFAIVTSRRGCWRAATSCGTSRRTAPHSWIWRANSASPSGSTSAAGSTTRASLWRR